MADNTTTGGEPMARYRLVRSERATWWVGSGVKVSRTNPVTLEEGTLEEVTAAALEEIRELAEWALERGEIEAESVPGPEVLEEIREQARLMAAGDPKAPADLPADPEGFWCLTLEEVRPN